MSSWINITPRLQEGLKIISKIENGKFRLLVNRICQGLASSANSDKIFSSEEEEKLKLSLNLQTDELNLLLDTVTLIYSQAAFAVVKPVLMDSVMKDKFSISEDKISVFVNAWITHAKIIIDSLRKKSIFPTQVEDINWSLNIQASTPKNAADAKPLALLQLNLNEAEEKKKLTLEFDKSSLSDLYDNLEKIQKQLDGLK